MRLSKDKVTLVMDEFYSWSVRSSTFKNAADASTLTGTSIPMIRKIWGLL